MESSVNLGGDDDDDVVIEAVSVICSENMAEARPEP